MCCVNVNSNNTQFIALYICINAIIHLFAYTIRYFCRSVEFDDQTKQCILSEEDSISQKDDISVSSSPTHHFYDLVCLDNRKSCTIQFHFQVRRGACAWAHSQFINVIQFGVGVGVRICSCFMFHSRYFFVSNHSNKHNSVFFSLHVIFFMNEQNK